MSVTSAEGFAAGGTACGIKSSGDLDLSLVAAEGGAAVPAAAVFTQNKVTAAPVVVSRGHLVATGGRAAAVVLNSGCANAATGARGVQDAEATCRAVAEALGCRSDEVLVCSTGLIGYELPMDRLRAGVAPLVASIDSGPGGGTAAADAILTTDTRRKESTAGRDGFVVGGMAKGSAMLAPGMATMLAVLTTDAEADPQLLQSVLAEAVAGSFNRISTDGCTSTNDTVVIMASGAAGPVDEAHLRGAVAEVCLDLATQMVHDAEGHTKVVRVVVTGAVDDEQAEAGARKIAGSQLVKCSWYGSDPYWGRVASELGVAGIELDPSRLSIRYGDHVVAEGSVAASVDQAALSAYMSGAELEVVADLGLGHGTAWVLTNDLTHAYVDENMGTS